MKPPEFKIAIPVKNYDENDRNCYVAEKRIVFKISDTDPKFYSTN